MDYLAVSRAERPYNWRTRPGPHRLAGRGFYISPIRRVRERIERVAATDFTVLIEEGAVQSRTPILLGFLGELPSVEARGRWRERGRMGGPA